MQPHVLASALAILTAVVGFPQTDEWRRRMDEGAAAETLGDYARAVRAYLTATEQADRFDRSNGRRAVTWNSIGTMYDALGQLSDAEGAYRKALKGAEESSGKSSANYAFVLGNLGTLYAEMGQLPRGEKMVREAVAIYLALEPRDAVRTAVTQNSLAEVLMAAGKFREAGPLLTEALGALEKEAYTGSDVGVVLSNLGVVRFLEGNRAEAERMLLRSLAMMEERVGPDHPLLLRTLNNLASLAGRMGNREEAGARFRRALDIAEKRLGTEHPIYGALLANYASYVREGGDKARAKALQARSVQILKDSGRRNGIGAVIDVSALKGK